MLALLLIIAAAFWRIVAAHHPAFVNFSPLMALTFCTAVYIRDRRWWVVPLIALSLSDLYLDRYYSRVYNYEWSVAGAAIRSLCFVASLGFGAMVARHRNWLRLIAGAVGGSLFFYIVTNTSAWLEDITYRHDLAGWWQALTVGHPEFPPTLLFFRNTFVSDLGFTLVFALVMELAARRAGAPSPLGQARRA